VTTTTEPPDDTGQGDIDEPAGDKPPPVEWVDPQFPDDTDDIPDDTHDDVSEVDTT
jgi:hypothetical protein